MCRKFFQQSSDATPRIFVLIASIIPYGLKYPARIAGSHWTRNFSELLRQSQELANLQSAPVFRNAYWRTGITGGWWGPARVGRFQRRWRACRVTESCPYVTELARSSRKRSAVQSFCNPWLVVGSVNPNEYTLAFVKDAATIFVENNSKQLKPRYQNYKSKSSSERKIYKRLQAS